MSWETFFCTFYYSFNFLFYLHISLFHLKIHDKYCYHHIYNKLCFILCGYFKDFFKKVCHFHCPIKIPYLLKDEITEANILLNVLSSWRHTLNIYLIKSHELAVSRMEFTPGIVINKPFPLKNLIWDEHIMN